MPRSRLLGVPTRLASSWPTTCSSSCATISRGSGMRLPGDQLSAPVDRSPAPHDGPSLLGCPPPVAASTSALCDRQVWGEPSTA